MSAPVKCIGVHTAMWAMEWNREQMLGEGLPFLCNRARHYGLV